ncbi:MAG: Endonuclease/Exonuclease/phosphatase family protein [Bacteroidota bacterium]|nr:Endonuclease/Exonuclease/phosphatase family protein [Bacteroidota bacterium]
MKRYLICVPFILLLTSGCKKSTNSIKQGTFTVMTYNIAGLPEPASGSHPATNTSLISKRLNDYDIVNVQEDFFYDSLLLKYDHHPYRGKYTRARSFGDGLNFLSKFLVLNFMRTEWEDCHGTDCYTPKGFTYSRVKLAEGAYIDLYNLHCNAGGDAPDYAARRNNVLQLCKYIEFRSKGNAVIIMGDTNTDYTYSQENTREILSHGFTDVWIELVRHGILPVQNDIRIGCGVHAINETDCEEVDKIFYRSNDVVKLTALEYSIPGGDFLDAHGEWLSDHRPVSAKFQFDVLK